MELPRRPAGDELLPAGALLDLRQRLRRLAPHHDLTTVIASAFDHRTRILPFLYADMKMIPAGVQAIGSAMADIGCHKTRIVLQQWNRSFRPSKMRLDCRIPDIFMVSSMFLHSAECDRLIEDVCRVDPQHRPLIVAGGPKVIYEPWTVFSSAPQRPWRADVAVTGEEYVLLSLLEVLLAMRAANEPIRNTFLRARDSGALDVIPGLVYSRGSEGRVPDQLVDTGIQQLVGDLDELPDPTHGYRLIEPPSRAATLGPHALKPGEIRRHSSVSSLVFTLGCKFRCHYCPIPAYNQRQYRSKSGDRIADEIKRIYNQFNLRNFFGADDNFFNDHQRTMQIVETLARRADAGSRPHRKIRWGTEATVHDTLRLQKHLPVIRRTGLSALWLGVEDITATLIKKGQNDDKTLEAFRVLREAGIAPVPMLMHHDEQPLVSWNTNYGLLNQLHVLRRAGAVYMQVLMLQPARGSKSFEDIYNHGLVYRAANRVPVEPHMMDGGYVTSSHHPRPWIKQLNLLVAYAFFFNPLRLAWALVRPKTKMPLSDADTSPPEEVALHTRWQRFRRGLRRKLKAQLLDAAVQLFGMWGLLRTCRRTLPWCWNLFRGRIERQTHPPTSRLPMQGAGGGTASHALPGTPRVPDRLVQLDVGKSKRTVDVGPNCTARPVSTGRHTVAETH